MSVTLPVVRRIVQPVVTPPHRVVPSGAPATGVLTFGTTIPKSGGGTWPHALDVYKPSGSITQALVILHGGLGTKETIAYQFDVLTNNTPTPTVSDVNWAMLAAKSCAVYVPQGQTCQTANAGTYNPHAVDTAAATWYNKQMFSGADDMSALADLRLKIKADNPSLTDDKIHIIGHSNGGMMVKRLLYDSPIFAGHGCVSGPVTWPYFYSKYQPATLRPMWEQWGENDNILGIYQGPQGSAASHWTDARWYMGVGTLSVADTFGEGPGGGSWTPRKANYVPPQRATPKIFSAWNTGLGAGSEAWSEAAGVVSGNLKTWSYAGGRVITRFVSGANHGCAQQETQTGTRIFDDFLSWVAGLPAGTLTAPPATPAASNDAFSLAVYGVDGVGTAAGSAVGPLATGSALAIDTNDLLVMCARWANTTSVVSDARDNAGGDAMTAIAAKNSNSTFSIHPFMLFEELAASLSPQFTLDVAAGTRRVIAANFKPAVGYLFGTPVVVSDTRTGTSTTPSLAAAYVTPGPGLLLFFVGLASAQTFAAGGSLTLPATFAASANSALAYALDPVGGASLTASLTIGASVAWAATAVFIPLVLPPS